MIRKLETSSTSSKLLIKNISYIIIFDVITCNRIYLSQPLVDKVINEISFESNRNSFVHSLSTVNEANWTITFVWLSWVCQKRKFDLWMACQTIMKKFIISKTLQHLGEVTKALVSCWYVKISLIRIRQRDVLHQINLNILTFSSCFKKALWISIPNFLILCSVLCCWCSH